MFGTLILYFLEIARYFLGNKIFFQKPLKRFWVILVMGGIHEGVFLGFLYNAGRGNCKKDISDHFFFLHLCLHGRDGGDRNFLDIGKGKFYIYANVPDGVRSCKFGTAGFVFP